MLLLNKLEALRDEWEQAQNNPCAAPDFSGHEFGVKPCQEKGAWNAE